MKKLTPLMIFHLVIMVLLLIVSVVGAVMLFGNMGPHEGIINDETGPIFRAYGALYMLNALAMCCGIVYILKGYEKSAASYYKVFILMFALSTTFGFVQAIRVTLLDGLGFVTVLSLITMLAKAIMLYILAFGEDLGKRKTWILFYISLVFDLVQLFVYFGQGMTDKYAVAIFARFVALVFDGTIGLAIRGKYADKERRGTK